MKIRLAEAYLRRKELLSKLSMLKCVKSSDDKSTHELTDEYNFYARNLRLLESAIQQFTWSADIDIPENVTKEYEEAWS